MTLFNIYVNSTWPYYHTGVLQRRSCCVCRLRPDQDCHLWGRGQVEGRPRHEGGDNAFMLVWHCVRYMVYGPQNININPVTLCEVLTYMLIVAIQVVTGDGSRVPAILLANKSDLREESTVMIMIIMIIMDTFMITIMITKSIFMITNWIIMINNFLPNKCNLRGGRRARWWSWSSWSPSTCSWSWIGLSSSWQLIQWLLPILVK